MPFRIGTQNVDDEVACTAGPQLVVPILNERFLLNAANARWGSLYDALYGTDTLGQAQPGGYDSVHGARVIARSRAFLDQAVPLEDGRWTNFTGGEPRLRNPAQLVGRGRRQSAVPQQRLAYRAGGRSHPPIRRDDPAGIADILLESALSTICDLEDSVAAVDAEDKVAVYANWLGLMRGDLTARFDKGGRTLTRTLAEDRVYASSDGSELVLPSRSLLLVRKVGHLMTTSAILLPDGSEAPEGILDGIMTSLIALHDLRGARRNSRAGSVYIVKPKMHGPEEASFTDRLFAAIEDLLGLARHTLKVGVMDEERRISANLAACIHAVRDRVAFINTGFLDRTGDEIHTSLRAGAMIPKGEMKTSDWIVAYEARHVAIGLACGLSGRAQIGKGMWAAPDRMADMLEQKIAHPRAGANTAWVPSPNCLDAPRDALSSGRRVRTPRRIGRQTRARAGQAAGNSSGGRLQLNRGGSPHRSRQQYPMHLGSAVRWINQGVGCSKVPDIDNIGLMETAHLHATRSPTGCCIRSAPPNR